MLGLDAIDKKILKTIRDTPLTASSIARKIPVSRTTIRYRLLHMRRTRLVRSVKGVGVTVLWQASHDRSIGKSSVSVFSGASFTKGYTALWKLKKQSVVFVIYGAEALRAEATLLPRSFILEAQRSHRRRQIIMKSIMHESFADIFRNLNYTDDEVLRSHLGRASGGKAYFSRNLFRGAGEVAVARTFILLIDTQHRRSILIRNRQIAAIVYDMAELLFDTIEHATTVSKFDKEKMIRTELARRATNNAVSGLHGSI